MDRKRKGEKGEHNRKEVTQEKGQKRMERGWNEGRNRIKAEWN